jgi:hypothetical protein
MTKNSIVTSYSSQKATYVVVMFLTKVHLPLKLSRLMLRKVNLKMTIVPCHLNPATWSLGGPLLPKMICLS